MLLVGIFAVLVFVYSLVARRLSGTLLTAPILFTLAGALTALLVPVSWSRQPGEQWFLVVAELTLVLLLFTDAGRTNLRELRRDGLLAVRLLSIGLLATVALGTLVAWWLFPALTIWQAAIVATILAPTDAGLGQVIVNSKQVPLAVRETLNVEAGLNDGLSVPLLLFFIALAASGGDAGDASLIGFVVDQLGLGALIGAGLGWCGGALMARAQRRRWLATDTEQLGVLVLPILAILLSEHFHASMFIAAFIAGLALQISHHGGGRDSSQFSGLLGELLSFSVFFLFGLMLTQGLESLRWSLIVYAVLSLTLIRMLPVALALWRTRLSVRQRLFMGWFGPRGLASIVLGLVFLQQQGGDVAADLIRQIVLVTVLLSILLHGLTAAPGIRWLAAKNYAQDSGGVGAGAGTACVHDHRDAAMNSEQFDLIARAIRSLQQQPELSLDTLAQQAGKSATHFQRLFAAWAGVSPKRFAQFVQRQRLQQLLDQTSDVLGLSVAAGLSGPGRLHDLVVTCDAMTPGELVRGGEQVEIRYGVAQTPFGQALIGVTVRGICHWSFCDAASQASELVRLGALWPRAKLVSDSTLVQQIADGAFVLNGTPQPLHLLLRGSNFQLKVWQALLALAPGQLATYADIAKLVKSPRAARAVGSALARNEIGWLIPCHRVIRASGEVGEYRWGSDRKLALLGWEQAHTTAPSA